MHLEDVQQCHIFWAMALSWSILRPNVVRKMFVCHQVEVVGGRTKFWSDVIAWTFDGVPHTFPNLGDSTVSQGLRLSFRSTR